MRLIDPARARTWLKTKIAKEKNFLAVGYTESGGGLSSLLLAEKSNGGSLQYVGRVGTGMSLMAVWLQILEAVKELQNKLARLNLEPRRFVVLWVKTRRHRPYRRT